MEFIFTGLIGFRQGCIVIQKNNYLTKIMKCGAVAVLITLSNPKVSTGNSAMEVNIQQLTPTDFFPRYPKDSVCPALTSLFGMSADLNGNKRNKLQTGIEGGRKGDVVIAPADGVVIAMWETNLGWGLEWSVLIQHTVSDLKISDEGLIYYSKFDHLRKKDVKHIRANMALKRGHPIGKVDTPGGNPNLPPKIHWAVYEISSTKSSNNKWVKNEFGFDDWQNDKARLIDPLYMMSLHQGKNRHPEVRIEPFTNENDYSQFKGFSYIFECKGPPARG